MREGGDLPLQTVGGAAREPGRDVRDQDLPVLRERAGNLQVSHHVTGVTPSRSSGGDTEADAGGFRAVPGQPP